MSGILIVQIAKFKLGRINCSRVGNMEEMKIERFNLFHALRVSYLAQVSTLAPVLCRENLFVLYSCFSLFLKKRREKICQISCIRYQV